MLLFVILSICLCGVLSAPQNCQPNKLWGRQYNFATNVNSTFYSDHTGGRFLVTASGGYFTYINRTTNMRYTSRDGRCTYSEVDPLPRCIPPEMEHRKEWFGLDRGFPVNTYLFPSSTGGPTRYLELTPKKNYPVAFGLVGESGTVNNLVINFGVRRGIKDMSVFDVDLSSCVAESAEK